ncbi:hypothetical protein M0805_004600 [Coniferiporia weirii]|nr:hypothetical protein M0805_004600 [Coniferiporia weirii]
MMKLVSAALGAVFVVFLILSPAAAQTGGTTGTFIPNSDASIVYSPEVCTIQSGQNCLGAWWDTGLDDGTSVKTTAGPSSSYNNVQTTLTVSFRGTNLEVHGLRDAYGANMILQLDSTAGAVNTSTGVGGAVLKPSLLAFFSDLDAQTVHTLSLGWFANNVDNNGDTNSYAYFDHLVIANFQAVENSTTTTASMQSSPTESLPPDSEGPSEPKLASGAIAGIVVVLLLLVLLVFASCYFLRHRRHFLFRRRKPLQRVNLTVSYDDAPGRTGSPASPAMTVLKAHPHTSLPPAYFAQWQAKGGSGYGAGDGYTSYLDLESGTVHGGESEGQSDTPERGVSTDMSGSMPKQRERKDGQLGGSEREGRNGRARFPVPLPPLKIPRKAPPRESALVYPPRAHQSTSLASSSKTPSRAGGSHAKDTQEETQKSPRTPYSVATATRTVARLQSAQIVQPAAARISGRESRHRSKTGASGSSLRKSGVSKVGPSASLPPLPPLPNPFEEKGRLSRAVKSVRARKSRAPAADHEGIVTTSPPRNLGFLAADPIVASSSLSSWSLDPRKSSANISLGSLPPPYALNP